MLHFTKVPGKNVGNIEMFTLSTCGWCRKTKNFLNEHNIAYSYLDMDTLPDDEVEQAETLQEKYNPEASFPTIVINGGEKVIDGYNLDELQKLAEG